MRTLALDASRLSSQLDDARAARAAAEQALRTQPGDAALAAAVCTARAEEEQLARSAARAAVRLEMRLQDGDLALSQVRAEFVAAQPGVCGNVCVCVFIVVTTPSLAFETLWGWT